MIDIDFVKHINLLCILVIELVILLEMFIIDFGLGR